jgi:hypothetical protein
MRIRIHASEVDQTDSGLPEYRTLKLSSFRRAWTQAAQDAIQLWQGGGGGGGGGAARPYPPGRKLLHH